MIKKFGFKQVGNTAGMFRFDGVILDGVHPEKITVSDGEIGFTYGGTVFSYAVERSGGKIVAFTNPDGVRTEVIRQ